MSLDAAHIRQCLRDFNLDCLFIEDLGWDHHTQHLAVSVEGREHALNALAQKRGVVAFIYAAPANARIPDYATRRKIEQQVAKSVREHLIVYADPSKTTQVWQWVKREAGKPLACREHSYHRSQSGDALIQKLQVLAFSLEEEEGLTLPGVLERVRHGLDVEHVTRRFYDRFKTEHDKFEELVQGVPDEEMERWYVSVMLNRLMFIYFIQKKQFLDDDTNYLGNRLAASKARGKDRFYGDFLCPLFFEGFAKMAVERPAATNALLGKVPYLNGGLFLRHQIEERYGKDIQISDSAFAKIFAFFDEYQWHLDERPLRDDREINPDVLGYIFEKYINQKQMGAYYTKEDITGYISQNTVIPFLFDAARQKCKIAFEGDQSVWRLLQADPDRYVYDSVKHGTPLPLPKEIAAGLKDVSKRTEWNKAAPSEYALPTEIWREVAARRTRYQEVREKLANGEIRDISDLITYNLNIRQFAQDVIDNCEGPELLRAFWHATEKITVLDPTVGSGAFLFAALNILEPLYEACLDRMQAFVDEMERSAEKHRPEKFGDFKEVLARIDKHSNRRYFVLKSIVINNLYGVDIMEEATEICKLRLFLKLVAQIDSMDRIEPLPDIDFNIRAGNTLVGFATRDEVQRAITTEQSGQIKMLSSEDQATLDRINEGAEIADRAFRRFREMQTAHGMDAKDFVDAKGELRERLGKLEDELNRYLAGEYGLDLKNQMAYQKWLESYLPFHWFIEFYGILKEGGFDVIIGNPPYVEYSKIRGDYLVRGYRTENCDNLYAFVLERSLTLVNSGRRIGVIVPLSFVSTDGFSVLRKLMLQNSLWVSNYAIRPAKLFEGVEHRLTIVIAASPRSNEERAIHSTRYRKWSQGERSTLVSRTTYHAVGDLVNERGIPKLGSAVEASAWIKLSSNSRPFQLAIANHSKYRIFYTRKFGHFVLFTDFVPSIKFEDGSKMNPTELKSESVATEEEMFSYIAHFNSTLTYWHLVTIADCRNLNKRDVLVHPVPSLAKSEQHALSQLGKQLMSDFRANASHVRMAYPNQRPRILEVIHPSASRTIIEDIDRVLAKHYGFTDEELDFIINYDIKYRMGRDAEEESE